MTKTHANLLQRLLLKGTAFHNTSKPVNSTANLLAYSIAHAAQTRKVPDYGVKTSPVSHGAAQTITYQTKRVNPNVTRAAASGIMTTLGVATEKVLKSRRHH